MQNIEFYDLEGAPLVRVYKNLLPNVDRLMEILIDSEKNPNKYNLFKQWGQWNDLGTQISVGLTNYRYVDDPFFEQSYGNDFEAMLMKEVYDAYYKTLENYSLDHNLPEDLTTFPDGPCFYKYDHTLPAPTPNTPEYNMNYHTDFAFSLKDNPGKKSITTCTMYLNDNYNGGEMVFNLEPRLSRPYYRRQEQFSDSEPYYSGRITYRPEAGDVVVFPSGNPEYLSDDGFYFHCVNRVTGGDKYFLSIFNSYEFAGSDYWQQGVEEYGKDLWMWLEKRRTYNAGFKKKAVSLDDPGRE